MATLNAQTAEAIEVPTLNLYRAVTVSCRARTQVEPLLADARSGSDSLLRALDHIVSLTATLQQYRPRLVAAERLAGELAAEINDLLPAPPFDLILYHMMIDLVAAQAAIHSLNSGPVPEALRELEAAELRVEARIGELDELIPALERQPSATR